MRLTQPVLLLDAAGKAEPLVQRLEIGGIERPEIVEVADAELVEPGLQGAVDAADARQVIARPARRRAAR